MKPLAERFGRHRGKISWRVIVDHTPEKRFGYRIRLNGAPVGSDRQNPEGKLFGQFDSETAALEAGQADAINRAEQALQTIRSKR